VLVALDALVEGKLRPICEQFVLGHVGIAKFAFKILAEVRQRTQDAAGVERSAAALPSAILCHHDASVSSAARDFHAMIISIVTPV
jgi:hypothetical protein